MKFCKCVLFVVLVAACVPAFAQAQRFDIPFNFVAGGKSFPAGQYDVQRVWKDNQSAWRIANANGNVMMLTQGVDSPNAAHQPSLVFLHVGEGYTLDQIWFSDHSGREVLRPTMKQTLVAQGAKAVEVGAE